MTIAETQERWIRLIIKFSTVILALFIFGTSEAGAKEISVGMGNYEPYYIAKGDTGIFPDILKAVFRYMPDHQPKFLFGRPNKRLWKDFENGKIDAVANVFDSAKLEGCKSDPVFRFRDIAISKTDRNLELHGLSDLKGLRVVAFQGAKKFMGPAFKAFDGFAEYSEIADQKLQSGMLYRGRADVSIGDMFLFLQSLGKIKAQAKEFAFHDIFPVLTTRMGFRDRDMCSVFNMALRKVKSSGEYEAIFTSYLNKFGYQK